MLMCRRTMIFQLFTIHRNEFGLIVATRRSQMRRGYPGRKMKNKRNVSETITKISHRLVIASGRARVFNTKLLTCNVYGESGLTKSFGIARPYRRARLRRAVMFNKLDDCTTGHRLSDSFIIHFNRGEDKHRVNRVEAHRSRRNSSQISLIAPRSIFLSGTLSPLVRLKFYPSLTPTIHSTDPETRTCPVRINF